MLVSGCLGMVRLFCNAEWGHAYLSGSEYAPEIQAVYIYVLEFHVPCLQSIPASFSFLIHSKAAYLFEIVFIFHCHLEGKAFANENGELIWSVWD